ncbi:MAG TPA: LUD domain-containing protein [Candidatus Acidoferrales bacterium]|nr:LUD domain-containing protein [Candidatus Acidoferrales bacterium]
MAGAKVTMTNREIIIGRIREALKIAAPHPALEEGATVPPPASPQKWLPPVSPALEPQIELFRKNVEDLKAEFCEYTLTGASEHVKKLATAGHWKKIGTHSGELTDAVASGLGLPIVRTDGGYAVNDLESCDAGLTECEALIAQTGSVMVSAPSAGGRALSVLPPHHVVLARRSQVVPDLSAALQHVQEKYQGKFPSFLSFISGPSRTGDIERILVLGAHGPKKLTILLLP